MTIGKIKCIPPKTTHQQGTRQRIVQPKGGGRPFVQRYKGKDLVEEEHAFVSLLKDYQTDKPLDGPLYVKIVAEWPFLKEQTKTRAQIARLAEIGKLPMCQKPDADNFAKMILDTLKRLCFIRDDLQVARLEVVKYHSHEPGITITIMELRS
jgi:Holliday junction resolvase RusA-like endonuclease